MSSWDGQSQAAQIIGATGEGNTYSGGNYTVMRYAVPHRKGDLA